MHNAVVVYILKREHVKCLLLDTAVCYGAGMRTKIHGQISLVLPNCLEISWKQAPERLLWQFLLLFSVFLQLIYEHCSWKMEISELPVIFPCYNSDFSSSLSIVFYSAPLWHLQFAAFQTDSSTENLEVRRTPEKLQSL